MAKIRKKKRRNNMSQIHIERPVASAVSYLKDVFLYKSLVPSGAIYIVFGNLSDYVCYLQMGEGWGSE